MVEIGTLADLQAINLDLAGHYRMVADIDASETKNWDGGRGFMPIAMGADNGFRGLIDGERHVVRHLHIDRPQKEGVGLFGINAGLIRNVRLADVMISGQESVGGIAGANVDGTITGCSVSGEVSGQEFVGGLVGFNVEGTIAGCSACTEVSGQQDIGGLVGCNTKAGTITESLASGKVRGRESAGGLAGGNSHEGRITGCSASGDVSGQKYVGGLVGLNLQGGKITESLASGKVCGQESCGGLVGGNSHEETTTRCYWVLETSGQHTSAGGEGRISEEMMRRSMYIGWDFENVWQIEEGRSYPTLRCLAEIIQGPEAAACAPPLAPRPSSSPANACGRSGYTVRIWHDPKPQARNLAGRALEKLAQAGYHIDFYETSRAADISRFTLCFLESQRDIAEDIVSLIHDVKYNGAVANLEACTALTKDYFDLWIWEGGIAAISEQVPEPDNARNSADWMNASPEEFVSTAVKGAAYCRIPIDRIPNIAGELDKALTEYGVPADKMKELYFNGLLGVCPQCHQCCSGELMLELGTGAIAAARAGACSISWNTDVPGGGPRQHILAGECVKSSCSSREYHLFWCPDLDPMMRKYLQSNLGIELKSGMQVKRAHIWQPTVTNGPETPQEVEESAPTSVENIGYSAEKRKEMYSEYHKVFIEASMEAHFMGLAEKSMLDYAVNKGAEHLKRSFGLSQAEYILLIREGLLAENGGT